MRILKLCVGIIFLVVAALLFQACDYWDIKIINNAKYSIGLVSNFSPGGRGGSFILFLYEVNGSSLTKSYGNGAHHWNVPSDGVHIGDKFMVQYDSLDLQTVRMLFSYPVKDSTDYKNDIALFKKNPPGYPSP